MGGSAWSPGRVLTTPIRGSFPDGACGSMVSPPTSFRAPDWMPPVGQSSSGRLTDGGPAGPRLPQDAIEVRLTRRVGPGLEERMEFTNHSMAARTLRIE